SPPPRAAPRSSRRQGSVGHAPAAGYPPQMARDPLTDAHSRLFWDLRVSVPARCNFRCQYCMPAEGLPWLDRAEVLTFEEIARVVALLADMGVHDVRLTGGRPLARRELWRLVEMLSADPNVHDLSLTTNGY